VPRILFSFQLNEGGRAVNSVVICESHCYKKNSDFYSCMLLHYSFLSVRRKFSLGLPSTDWI
jgi:hypothetical protein